MARPWSRSRCFPIGLDLGQAHLRMLQLAPGSGGLKVGAAAHRAMPPEMPTEGPQRRELLIETCRATLKQARFRGRQVVANISHPSIRYKNVRLPRMSEEELKRAVRWEAAERFGQEAEHLSVQHINVGELHGVGGDEARQEVILIGIPEAVVTEHTEVLRACGLQPAILEVTPTALASYFSRMARRQSDQGTVRAVVDLGSGGSRVLILRGCAVMFYRPLMREAEPVGVASAAEAAGGGGEVVATREATPKTEHAAEIQPAEVEDLARQVDMSLRYYSVTFRGEPPEAVYLCGGRSQQPGLAPMLTERLGLDVQPMPALHEVDLSGADPVDPRNALPRWAVAAGLALRDVNEAAGADAGGHS